MPQTQNATIRYKVLDRCFKDFRHRYYIDDLIDACAEALFAYNGSDRGISRRTIFDDITFMESSAGWSIPLERLKDGKKVYYRYANRDFSIFSNELSDNELSQIKTTVDVLSRYRGLPSTEWIKDVVSNLEYRFGLKPHNTNVLCFDQNERLKGIEYLSKVIDAASHQQTVLVKYQAYGADPVDWIIYPYYIKQYNNRWFMFGLNKQYGTISNIPLDRICGLELSDISFVKNETIDFEHYFDDIIGVTIPPPEVQKEHIELEFDQKRLPYIISKPIHDSQDIVDKEKGIISIDVRPNKELESLILSFGPQVKVLSPEDFQKQIKEKIEENAKKYF